MILVFGSINADLIVPVPRLPRPGETVLGGDYAMLPGGKGANQALAARRAGAAVVLAGAVGADAFADIALDLLRREGVDTRLVQVVDQPTGCAAIMVSKEGENLIAVASGANMSVRSGQVADELLELARVASHTKERRFAPLACFMAGVAVERLRQAGLSSAADEAAYLRAIRERVEAEP